MCLKFSLLHHCKLNISGLDKTINLKTPPSAQFSHYYYSLFSAAFFERKKKKCPTYFVVQCRIYAYSYWLSLTHAFKLSFHKAKYRSGREMLPPLPLMMHSWAKYKPKSNCILMMIPGSPWDIMMDCGYRWEGSVGKICLHEAWGLLWMCRHRSGIMRLHCVGVH